MRFTIKLMHRASLAFLLATAIAPVIRGQQNTSRTSSLDRVLTKRTREFNAMELEKELRRPPNKHEERLTLEQIKEDYLHIQIASRDLSQAVSLGDALDLKSVAKSSLEIRKCAKRLKHNLVLPKSAEEVSKLADASAGTEAAQLKSSVTALNNLIDGFVNNPLFHKVNVVDAQSSVKARRDLEQIMLLSEHVKRSSEKLDRAATAAAAHKSQ